MRSRRIRRQGIFFTLAAILAAGVLVPGASVPAHAATDIHITVAGDYAANANTSAVLGKVASLAPQAHLAIGDFSYGQTASEAAWCSFVTDRVGTALPFELLTGNHESTDHGEGAIDKFAACLPNKVPGMSGSYGREYVLDFPANAPVVRFIEASPALSVDSTWWAYAAGGTHYKWVSDAIDAGRAKGAKWIVVTAHIPCLSVGDYTCPSTDDFYQLMLSKKVDLVIDGHEHAYMRTHQLRNGVAGCTTLTIGTANPSCVADVDSTFAAGAGTVFATVGTGGAPLRTVNLADPELGYFSALSGSNRMPAYGVLDLHISETRLTASFAAAGAASFYDVFFIDQGAVATTLADDTFSRNVPTGWGSATIGGAWNVSANGFAVNGSQGTITTAPGNLRTAVLSGVNSNSAYLVSTLAVDQMPSGLGLYASSLGRTVAGVGDYRSTLRLLPDGSLRLGLSQVNSAGSETALVTPVRPSLTFAPGTWLKVRTQVTGTNPTTIRARVWPGSDPEPSTWQVSTTHNDPAMQTSGSIGLASYLAKTAGQPVTLRVDAVRAR